MANNYSVNSSINKSMSSKGRSTKSRTSSNESAEESGWTAYFEDYDQQNSHLSSSFSCSVSLFSGSSTTGAGASSSTFVTFSKVPKKLRFKKTRTKEICGDDSLEDTATSPINSPKVRDVKSTQKERRSNP